MQKNSKKRKTPILAKKSLIGLSVSLYGRRYFRRKARIVSDRQMAQSNLQNGHFAQKTVFRRYFPNPRHQIRPRFGTYRCNLPRGKAVGSGGSQHNQAQHCQARKAA